MVSKRVKKADKVRKNLALIDGAGIKYERYTDYHIKVDNLNFFLSTERFNLDGGSTIGRGVEAFIRKVTEDYPFYLKKRKTYDDENLQITDQ